MSLLINSWNASGCHFHPATNQNTNRPRDCDSKDGMGVPRVIVFPLLFSPVFVWNSIWASFVMATRKQFRVFSDVIFKPFKVFQLLLPGWKWRNSFFDDVLFDSLVSPCVFLVLRPVIWSSVFIVIALVELSRHYNILL